MRDGGGNREIGIVKRDREEKSKERSLAPPTRVLVFLRIVWDEEERR